MRELALRVPRAAVEDVLDRLLPIIPTGVREVDKGREVELVMRGPELPDAEQITDAAGRWPHLLTERETADDWRVRRRDDYEPDVIGGGLIVRPEWAPRPRSGVIDIALSDGAAFGLGTHPTTRTCLEQLLALAPRGAFADLGCGTGVLAICAAKLGWDPVIALDVQPGSVETAAANAAANGVPVRVAVCDLSAEPPPAADGIAANIPAELHRTVAASLAGPPPAVALVSGFGPGEADAVSAAYAARGLTERRRIDASHWTVLVLEHTRVGT
jgi:ribosomal protein L11 methyltransferase